MESAIAEEPHRKVKPCPWTEKPTSLVQRGHTPADIDARLDDGLAKEVAKVVHTCRDFDVIGDWAKCRTLRVMLDTGKVVD